MVFHGGAVLNTPLPSDQELAFLPDNILSIPHSRKVMGFLLSGRRFFCIPTPQKSFYIKSLVRSRRKKVIIFTTNNGLSDSR